ncbi:MAG: hypothetical protein GOU99_01675 [Candidatus Altiarchaeota archaeon]|nr:hypothetical protein [Candidatus Altiarchaeota archaeon]
MTTQKAPIISMKSLKKEIQEIKRISDPALLLRLLDYVESREKLLKDLLIHMNAVENHLVKTAELLQKMPQVNMADMLTKLDDIANNTKKMVDYLEMAVNEPVEDEPKLIKRKSKPIKVVPSSENRIEPAKPKREPIKKKEPVRQPEPVKEKDDTSEKLEKITKQNKALIDALNQVSDGLQRLGE